MKRVLIVDDSKFMRHSLRDILERNGFEVIGEAENGVEAIEKYKDLQPDIVTMDITMPELDGIEATRVIKAIDKEAKIVMISSMGQESFVKKGVEAGASNFIVKPFYEKKIVLVLGNM